MSSALDPKTRGTRASDLHLLRDCLSLGRPGCYRVPVKVRLEEALGVELTRRLLASLSSRRDTLA